MYISFKATNMVQQTYQLLVLQICWHDIKNYMDNNVHLGGTNFFFVTLIIFLNNLKINLMQPANIFVAGN